MKEVGISESLEAVHTHTHTHTHKSFTEQICWTVWRDREIFNKN